MSKNERKKIITKVFYNFSYNINFPDFFQILLHLLLKLRSMKNIRTEWRSLKMLKEFLNSSWGKSCPFSHLDRASENFPFLGGEREAPRGKQDELHYMQERAEAWLWFFHLLLEWACARSSFLALSFSFYQGRIRLEHGFSKYGLPTWGGSSHSLFILVIRCHLPFLCCRPLHMLHWWSKGRNWIKVNSGSDSKLSKQPHPLPPYSLSRTKKQDKISVFLNLDPCGPFKNSVRWHGSSPPEHFRCSLRHDGGHEEQCSCDGLKLD